MYNGVNDNYIPQEQYYASANGYVVVDLNGLWTTLTWVQRISAGNYADMETWTYQALPVPMPGDLNCDGVINFDDIDPFVLALSGPDTYYAQYPDCNWLNADCNGDGVVNCDDINPFVAILSGGA